MLERLVAHYEGIQWGRIKARWRASWIQALFFVCFCPSSLVVKDSLGGLCFWC